MSIRIDHDQIFKRLIEAFFREIYHGEGLIFTSRADSVTMIMALPFPGVERMGEARLLRQPKSPTPRFAAQWAPGNGRAMMMWASFGRSLPGGRTLWSAGPKADRYAPP